MNFDKQLYDSGLIADGCWNQLDDYAKEAILRFGEAIVNKAIVKIEDEYQANTEDTYEAWDRGYLGGLRSSISIIKNHFGVE